MRRLPIDVRLKAAHPTTPEHPIVTVTADLARAVAGGGNVDIAGGARTVRQYLREGLVDELQLHVVPALLGAGLRLLDGLGAGRRDVQARGDQPSGRGDGRTGLGLGPGGAHGGDPTIRYGHPAAGDLVVPGHDQHSGVLDQQIHG